MSNWHVHYMSGQAVMHSFMCFRLQLLPLVVECVCMCVCVCVCLCACVCACAGVCELNICAVLLIFMLFLDCRECRISKQKEWRPCCLCILFMVPTCLSSGMLIHLRRITNLLFPSDQNYCAALTRASSSSPVGPQA